MANEKRLIDANKIPYQKSGFPKGDGFDSGLDWAFRKDIDKLPTVDAVSRGAHDQVRWERDVAIEQLESYGISLGEKAEVAKVVRCKDCKHWHEETGWCNHHSHFIGANGEACHPWESSDWKMLNADDFCSYGERRTDEKQGG